MCSIVFARTDVLSSSYAALFGIKVAYLGLVWSTALVLLTLRAVGRSTPTKPPRTKQPSSADVNANNTTAAKNSTSTYADDILFFWLACGVLFVFYLVSCAFVFVCSLCLCQTLLFRCTHSHMYACTNCAGRCRSLFEEVVSVLHDSARVYVVAVWHAAVATRRPSVNDFAVAAVDDARSCIGAVGRTRRARRGAAVERRRTCERQRSLIVDG